MNEPTKTDDARFLADERTKQQAKEKLAEIKKISGTQTRLWSKTGPIFPEELFDLIEQAGFELPL